MAKAEPIVGADVIKQSPLGKDLSIEQCAALAADVWNAACSCWRKGTKTMPSMW